MNALIAALQQVEGRATPQEHAVAVVAFQRDAAQKYGFDEPAHSALQADYPATPVAGQTVRASWKSLESNVPDQVLAIDPSAQTLTFEHNGVPVVATAGPNNNSYKLTLTGASDGTQGELLALAGDQTVGVLQTISYSKKYTSVKIVPVNGGMGNHNLANLQQRLDAIYAPAVAGWQVEVLPDQNLGTAWDTNSDGKLGDGETGMLSNYTEEMNNLIEEFRKRHNRSRDTYYVFLVGQPATPGKLGFMPRKKQWGFVFTNNHGNTDALVKTIAHELGHGVYRLEHPFAERGLPRGETDNLMDYSNGTALYKYQWDFVHDPASVLTLFEEDEDASLDRCDWQGQLFALIYKSEIDKAIEAQMPLFNEVRANYDKYFNDSKKDNIPVNGFTGWTIRKASHTNGKGKQLVEKAILKLYNEDASEIVLNEKGVTLGTYKIEEQEFKIAAFSTNEVSNVIKVEVDELCKLAENEDIRVIAEDDFVLINYIKDKKVEFTILVDKGGDSTAELWMKYLGVFKPSQQETKSFWLSFMDAFSSLTCSSGFCCTKCGKDLAMTQERFSEIFPNVSNNKQEYTDAFNVSLQDDGFKYITCERQAKIFAQILIETNSLTATKEGEGKTWKITGKNQLLDYFKATAGAKIRWFNQDFWETKLYKNFSQVGYYEKIENGESISEDERFAPGDTTAYFGVYNGTNQAQYKVDIPGSFSKRSGGEFKKYGTPSLQLKQQIEKNIFNYAYGNRLGNGDYLTTDDGYNFRGKGAIQLTGKGSYIALNNKLKLPPYSVLDVDIVSNPDLIAEDPRLVVYSAFIHFKSQLKNDIKKLDELSIDKVSALVNTGNENGTANHETERKNKYLELIKNEFNCKND